MSSPEFLTGSSENKVMMLLKVNSRMTLDKIAEHLNMTKRGVQKVTNRLQEAGVLSRKGSKKAGEWIVNQGIK
ncbi:MAG: HTH domain-containing protein [Bacteroides sp.]|nr:HTH domain-containing protein [Bacteroides sp.]